LDHFPDGSKGEDPREGTLSSKRALAALLGTVCLTGVTACRQQQDLYCIAIRYARADAGAESLGSPFDALPAGSEINPHDVVGKPHILVTERGKTTLSHVEHPFYDEVLRERKEGGAVYFVGDEDEKHPFVRQRVGQEERLRYGFQGRRCLQWDLPVGCRREVREYMTVDLRCGPTMQWLQSQPP
jgi:hypothetical protein